jgi:hypothetical protein
MHTLIHSMIQSLVSTPLYLSSFTFLFTSRTSLPSQKLKAQKNVCKNEPQIQNQNHSYFSNLLFCIYYLYVVTMLFRLSLQRTVKKPSISWLETPRILETPSAPHTPQIISSESTNYTPQRFSPPSSMIICTNLNFVSETTTAKMCKEYFCFHKCGHAANAKSRKVNQPR